LGEYDLYKNRISAYGDTIREGRISAITNLIKSTFADSPSYFEVLINDNEDKTGVLIVDDSTTINQANQNNKIIIMQPEDILNAGHMIKYQNKDWLCVASELFNDIYYKGKITKCNNVLTLNQSGILYQVPCCVESAVRLYQLGVEESKYVTEPSTTVVVRVANNETTQLIKRNDKYKLSTQTYEVIDKNDDIEPGLIVLKMEFCAEQQVLPTYTINILNGTDLSLILGNTLTLNAEVLADDNIISPTPPLIYESSNDEIATVENGIITSVAIGECIIAVSLESDPTVTVNIDLSVEEIVEDLFTVDVYGDSTVVLSDNITLEALVYNNGAVDETKGVNWTLSNDDGSSNVYLTIASQDSNSITLTATSDSSYKNKYVTVKGSYTKDGSIFDTHQVKIISLF
jgi:hypothetical protein